MSDQLHRSSDSPTFVIALALVLGLGGGSYAAAATQADPETEVIDACLLRSGLVRIVDTADDCRRRETSISWNVTGVQGPPGEDGVDGAPGEDPRFGTDTGLATGGRLGWEGCYVGQVQLWAGLQSQGILANGQLLPVIDELRPLFELFGTVYGGDGTSTFGVPDLESAAPNGTT